MPSLILPISQLLQLAASQPFLTVSSAAPSLEVVTLSLSAPPTPIPTPAIPAATTATATVYQYELPGEDGHKFAVPAALLEAQTIDGHAVRVFAPDEQKAADQEDGKRPWYRRWGNALWLPVAQWGVQWELQNLWLAFRKWLFDRDRMSALPIGDIPVPDLGPETMEKFGQYLGEVVQAGTA